MKIERKGPRATYSSGDGRAQPRILGLCTQNRTGVGREGAESAKLINVCVVKQDSLQEFAGL